MIAYGASLLNLMADFPTTRYLNMYQWSFFHIAEMKGRKMVPLFKELELYKPRNFFRKCHVAIVRFAEFQGIL